MKNESLLRRLVLLKLIVVAFAFAAFAQSTDKSSRPRLQPANIQERDRARRQTTFIASRADLVMSPYARAKGKELLDVCSDGDLRFGMRTVATANMNAATTSVRQPSKTLRYRETKSTDQDHAGCESCELQDHARRCGQ
jgi:hypothetical protein